MSDSVSNYPGLSDRVERRDLLPAKRRKHVPLRSCIACHEKRAKRDLVRIVRTPEGAIEIDPKGKRSGRGAYLCRRQRCWDTALQPRRLSRALKCEIGPEEVAMLKAQALPFIEESAVGSQATSVEASAPGAQAQ